MFLNTFRLTLLVSDPFVIISLTVSNFCNMNKPWLVEVEYINNKRSKHYFDTQQECYDFCDNYDDDFVDDYTIRKVS